MSLINRVLQDLDRRNAPAPEAARASEVRAIPQAAVSREWFWRILAFLMLAALGWIGWVAYHMQPRSVATDLAFGAAEQARKKQAAAAAPRSTVAATPAAKEVSTAVPREPLAPTPVAPVEPPTPAGPTPIAERAVPAAPTEPVRPIEGLRLAESIDTPILGRASGASRAGPASPEPERPQQVQRTARVPGADVPTKNPASEPAATPESKPLPAAKPAAKHSASETTARLSKRERPRSGPEEAESLFRHGVSLLKQRRVSEAQESFAAALVHHPGHEAARQAYVSILLDRRQMDDARRVLDEGLALNPTQTQFATVLARIHVEKGDYRGAAGILTQAAGAARDDADYQVLHGAVLQRLSRHTEAVDAFQNATRVAPQPGATWVALGVSLEALGRKADAVQAYRRSLSAPIAPDVRVYAENRIRALD